MFNSSKEIKPSNDGFSLVEVSIAMAIAAVALVSLIGLIPQGLKTMSEAVDQAIEGRIHQQILSEIQMTPFRGKSNSPDLNLSPLRSFHKQVRIYDTQGVELGYIDEGGSFKEAPNTAKDTADIEFRWVYSARIWLPYFESGNTPDSVGGNDTGSGGVTGTSEEELLSVLVETVPFQFPGDSLQSRLSNAHSFLSDKDNFRDINVFRTTVARMGMDYSQ